MRNRSSLTLQPNDYELRLARDSDWPSSSAFATASLAVRATADNLGVHEREIVKVAAGVAAPLLADFLAWTLRQAAASRLEHLYFLARDGEQLLRVARILGPAIDPSIELSYLQVSRLTLNLAASFDVSDESSRWLLARAHRMTPRELSNRLRLDEHGTRRLLELSSVRTEDWDQPLGRAAGTAILSSLTDSKAAKIVAESAQDIRARALPYLQQSGVLADARMGVVDVGGAGSQVWALNRLRRELGLPSVEAFFMARYRNPSILELGSSVDLPAISSYLLDEVSGQGIDRYGSVMTLVDAFCTGSHGRVFDYQVVNGTWVPKLAPFDSSAVSDWGLPALVGAVERTVEIATSLSPADGSSTGVPRSVLANLRRFVTKPTSSEAFAWGALPASDIGAGQLATSISWRDLGRLARGSIPSPGVRQWWAGSRQQSTLSIRAATRVGATLRHVRNP